MCAKLVDGGLRCWGGNHSAQLGNGGYTDSATPVVPIGVNGVLSVSAGLLHTCAASPSGTWCWGLNNAGQAGLGQATPANVATPTIVSGVGGTKKVAAGRYHTCTVTTQDEVKCWGYNSYGELGNEGVGGYSYAPVTVTATW